MSELTNFKTSAFGYDKDEVKSKFEQLINENKALTQQVEAISKALMAKQDEQAGNSGVIMQYETKIKSLEDRIHELEYQLYQMNESYQELQSHANQFTNILASANAQKESIIQSANIKANDIIHQAEDEFLASLPSATPLQSDIAKLNYFKANRNLAIIKQAVILLQKKLNVVLDDIDHQEDRLAEININE